MAASPARKTKQNQRHSEKESEKKWGKPAIAAGFTILPNMLFYKQHALSLSCTDLVLILQIAKHWWRADQSPYPSHKQLATTMSVHPATVKRRLKRLKDVGLISWTHQPNKSGGQGANAYNLSGLVKLVNEFSKEELVEREEKATARKERQHRKRPNGKPALRVLKGSKP